MTPIIIGAICALFAFTMPAHALGLESIILAFLGAAGATAGTAGIVSSIGQALLAIGASAGLQAGAPRRRRP